MKITSSARLPLSLVSLALLFTLGCGGVANGDGTFTALPAISATGIFKVATGDFNGDGKADLVLVNPGPGTVTILLANGDGTFPRKETIPVAGGPQAVAVGDFNRDGKQD